MLAVRWNGGNRMSEALLFCFMCLVAPNYGRIEPSRSYFDYGWLARAHWGSAAFDYSTTGLADRECLGLKGYPAGFPLAKYCGEQNPALWPLVGHHVNPPYRLALTFAGESAAVSLIPSRRLRHITQIGLIASHMFFGARNLRRWH